MERGTIKYNIYKITTYEDFEELVKAFPEQVKRDKFGNIRVKEYNTPGYRIANKEDCIVDLAGKPLILTKREIT